MPEQRVEITIPEGVTIDSLGLSRDPATGHIRFSWQPVGVICEASGIDVSLFRDQDEGNVAGLLILWYEMHLRNGGSHNAVLDELLAEERVEQAIDAESSSGGWTP